VTLIIEDVHGDNLPCSNILISQCYYCWTYYGVKDARGAPGGISHGFCAACAKMILNKVRRREADDTE